jgi:hypothetical protein
MDLLVPVAHSVHLRGAGLRIWELRAEFAVVREQVQLEEDVGGVCFHCFVSHLSPCLLEIYANKSNSFTNLVGTVLEGRLWDVQRFKGAHTNNGVAEDKHHGAPVAGTDATGAHPTTSVV